VIAGRACRRSTSRAWRFYTTERGSGGTGLGLAIVKAIAEAHHGRVWVEQMPDEGAAFSVELT
jgi:signal transduction histidine kinase